MPKGEDAPEGAGRKRGRKNWKIAGEAGCRVDRKRALGGIMWQIRDGSCQSGAVRAGICHQRGQRF